MRTKFSPRLEARLQAEKKARRAVAPELDDLDLAAWLPDEQPPIGDAHGVTYWSPDGVRLGGTRTNNSMLAVLQVEAFRQDPNEECFLRCRPFYRSGALMRVSTAYVGLDMNVSFINTSEHVPLFWETLVFTGAGLSENFGARYASRRAAKAGHLAVIEQIQLAQRVRRATWRIRPRPHDVKLLQYVTGALD